MVFDSCYFNYRLITFWIAVFSPDNCFGSTAIMECSLSLVLSLSLFLSFVLCVIMYNLQVTPVASSLRHRETSLWWHTLLGLFLNHAPSSVKFCWKPAMFNAPFSLKPRGWQCVLREYKSQRPFLTPAPLHDATFALHTVNLLCQFMISSNSL